MLSDMTDGVHRVEIEPVSPAYRRYAVSFLMLTMLLSFLDRQIINILAEPIKQELGLADWQIGLMTGFAFAIFYTTFGIPIARLAERKSRPLIITCALGAWSFFTILCGFAGNFVHLLLARIGVGAGEAGGIPPAHSLISDYTPREKRASALAFFHLGVPFGTLFGLGMGGVIVDLYGWRHAFLIAGIPGVAIALLALLTLKEPRHAIPPAERPAIEHPSFPDTLRYLASKRSYWFISFGAALKAFVSYAQVPFTAAFFFRVHGEQLEALASRFGLGAHGFLGISLGIISGFGGMVGILLGGQLGDRFGRTDARAYCAIPAIASLAALPFTIAVYLVPSAPVAMALMIIPIILGSFWFGPVYTVGQSVVPPTMRATSSAILLFILNAIGLGLGPLSVGLLSDLLATSFGLGDAEGVRWALIASSLLALGTFALFWTAKRTVRVDMVP